MMDLTPEQRRCLTPLQRLLIRYSWVASWLTFGVVVILLIAAFGR